MFDDWTSDVWEPLDLSKPPQQQPRFSFVIPEENEHGGYPTDIENPSQAKLFRRPMTNDSQQTRKVIR